MGYLNFCLVYAVSPKAIRETSAQAVQTLLRGVREKLGSRLYAEDQMDDGTKLVLTVTLSPQGTAHFDFKGTGVETFNNLNAPSAITSSAILYCLRCMLNTDIPLNQGCLAPLTLHIPPGCILSPSPTAAVVAGNVLTSQRIVDVILKAFQVCAASQGDCNNLTFGKAAHEGTPGWGYYETIAGGAGAGPTWHGRSGVHTHMTNTRITDPEVLEHRYPVILNTFQLRLNSGGLGEFRGGDGVERTFTFLEKVQVSILSERRVLPPYGMQGGLPGQCGLNLMYRDHRWINLGGKRSLTMYPFEQLKLFTPGGGGFGLPKEHESDARHGSRPDVLVTHQDDLTNPIHKGVNTVELNDTP
ncbi:hypothetical protein HMI54_009344 [Coelomomyces lativittatus]|nr:hypothetical protein HMI54_009344 [Coelomomyces lativittatus]